MGARNIHRLLTAALKAGYSFDLASGDTLIIKPLVDNQGSIEVGDGTLDFDLKFFLGATGAYVTLDVSAGKIEMTGAEIDLNGNELILDADGDTSLTADTDDQLDVKIGGSDTAVFFKTGFQDRGTEAITATAGGGTTGLISAGTKVAIITSSVATKAVSLPIASIGDVIKLVVGANGCELISAVTADEVNDVVVGATNELALPADTHYICEYIAATKWIVRGFTKLGADAAALVPDSL